MNDPVKYFTRRRMHREGGDYIDEQHKRSKLEDLRESRVGDENHCREADAAEHQGEENSGPPTSRPTRVGHGGDVGGQIDHIGKKENADGRVREPRRVMKPYVAREPGSADTRDPGARFLDNRHQRVGKNKRPEHREAELSADL